MRVRVPPPAPLHILSRVVPALGDYREVDGIRLPTTWNLYEPEKGESTTATFEHVAVNPEPDPELFAVPDAVRPFLRSPEEVEADNARLEEHTPASSVPGATSPIPRRPPAASR